MEVRGDAGGKVRVTAPGYSLVVDPAGPWLEMTWSGGRVRLGGSAAGSAGILPVPEVWTASRGVGKEGPEVALTSAGGPIVRFECRADVVYFRATIPDPGGSPAVLVGPDLPDFPELFSPEPTALRKSAFGPNERAITSIGSDMAFYRGHWIFSPPPFCFVVAAGDHALAPTLSQRESEAQGGLVIGVADRVEALQFSAFEYDHGAFVFRFDRSEHGLLETPALVLIPFVGDYYQGVQAYCDHLRRVGLAPAGTGRKRAEWWSEPIFCGWGEQSYRRVMDSDYPTLGVEPEKADRYYLPDGIQSNATQSFYEAALERLGARGINPGIVTIDDKWQIAYGLARPDLSRWPDLKGFIEQQHVRGRHVLLWWKLWDGEGLPPDELLGGWPYPVVDPTAPEYRKRVFKEMQYALGELGADGLKIDILHRGPTRPHGPSRSGQMGASLHKEMLALIRDAAIAAKEDALLVAHAANPYFADVADAVRLNDISTIPGNRSFLADMRHRARIARAACPEALIDTDNWPCPDRQQWREYVAAQPEIGIPALYYASGIEMSKEAFEPEDYELVRETWRRWRSGGYQTG